MSVLVRLVQLAAAVVILVAAWMALYRPVQFQSYFPQPELQAPQPDRSYSRVEAEVLDTVRQSHAALQDANVAIEALTRQLAAANEEIETLVQGADLAEDARNTALSISETNDGLISAAGEVQKAARAAALAAEAQSDLAVRAEGRDEEAAVAALMRGQVDGQTGSAGDAGASENGGAIEPRWGVVFGAELTEPAAERMLTRATQDRPHLEARLYRRNGFFRGVLGYPTHAAAMQSLPDIRARVNSDAFVVSLARWCPHTGEDGGVVQCGP